MVLSPWPVDADDRGVAVDLVASETGAAEAVAARVGAAAAAIVERLAPGAPDEVKDEAVLRLAGWLADQRSPAGVQETEESVGEIRVRTRYTTVPRGAWQASGAAGLLSPWIARRAI